MVLRQLLDTLADGQFHSGEELGELLGVSRTAVWKQLQKLQELTDLSLESIKGRGYRLVGGLELLDAKRITAVLSPDAQPLLSALNILDQVDSTNHLAMVEAQAGAGRGYTVTAEQQTAGRGRRGRAWVSPFGRNIYSSTVWEFDGGAAALEGLSLAVGVAAVKALRAVGLADAQLKWPNDVVWHGRKLAGILLEMTGDASGRCQVTVGVGINVAMTGSHSAESINQPWVDVQSAAGIAVSRNELLGRLLSELLPMLAQFEQAGFSRFRQQWLELDCMAGKAVTVHLGEEVVAGIAAGVDEGGALLVDTPSGRQSFRGGEVSLRLQQ